MTNVYQAPQADLTPKPQTGEDNPVTQTMINNLAKGRAWAKFLAILGYIFAGLIALGGLSGLAIMSQSPIVGLLVLVLYEALAFLVFRMSRFVGQYSNSIRSLIEYGDLGDMLDAQESFRRYMKWMAILMIIMVVISILTLVGGALGFAFLSGQF